MAYTETWNEAKPADTDFIFDGSGQLRKFKVAIRERLLVLSPIGSIIDYGSDTPPEGWLVCDGSAISRATYADLFAVIGTAFGNGDGATTFNLPDKRGRFSRGRANGQATDPDRATRTAISGGNTGDNVGSYQTDQYLAHNHTLYRRTAGGGSTGYSSALIGQPSYTYAYTYNAGGNESRPINVYCTSIIKYSGIF